MLTNSSLPGKQITLHSSADKHKTFVPLTRKRKGDSGSSYGFYQRFTGFGLRIKEKQEGLHMVLLVVDAQKGIVDERLYAFEKFVSNIKELIRTAR